jgi:hypothetical protein
MNTYRILRLAEILEQLPPGHPFGFTSTALDDECHPVAIMARNPNDFGPRISGTSAFHYCCEALTINLVEYRYLFDAEWAHRDPTPYGCSMRLRGMAARGEVPTDWHCMLYGRRPLPYGPDQIERLRNAAGDKYARHVQVHAEGISRDAIMQINE